MKYLHKNSKILSLIVAIAMVSSCTKVPSNGELIGVQGRKFNDRLKIPYGMVYIPAGSFMLGQSDEDITYSQVARQKHVSISGFYMDQTEITNNEYRQFVYWVQDGLAAKIIGGKYMKKTKSGVEKVNRERSFSDLFDAESWREDKKPSPDIQKAESLYYKGDDKLFGKTEVDPSKLVYKMEWFDYQKAVDNIGQKVPRSNFIRRDEVEIYPDTLVWLADFSYAQNEPMVEQYFTHPAYDEYPVVGVTWRQARAFAHWRTKINDDYRAETADPVRTRGAFSLPTESQWEYAARGGLNSSPYPWGGPYLRNSKGCLLANFKPGRGDYASDGGLYTVHVKSYFPNDYGLFNMAGNVSEWTSSTFDESAYVMVNDLNPTYTTEIEGDNVPLANKRKVIRGGSWKDIGYFLQNGVRAYEYIDNPKAYIGFRCVLPIIGRGPK
ncbi:MAG: SUMF1/EgtB/PvdO family nonheme iron enzyme [Solitalea-like symbiont of Acarus siro]